MLQKPLSPTKFEAQRCSESRRFLVLARVGDKSLHKSWLTDAPVSRTWDLQLNAYGKNESLFRDGDLPTVFDNGTKWDSIARHFRAHPDLFDRYDYIMLPDDDLLMKAADINRLFEIAVEHDLTMAQPALTLESYLSYPILLRMPGFRLRYSTFLEAMACCIKSSYLRSLLPLFERHSSWGTDLVWGLLMENPAFRAAIVDEVPMTHTRPLYTGPLYDTLAERRVDPRDEVRVFTASFENLPPGMQIYGGYLANGRRVGPFEVRIRNAIGLLNIAGRSKLRFNSYRMGFALLMRAFTRLRYRPEQLRAVAGSAMAELGLGAPSLSSVFGMAPSETTPSGRWHPSSEMDGGNSIAT
ncbi:DUF707 domain-containing protein [Rhizobiaceae bacterium n13]|uniref:DUF707 domain-containing protein n=1 Tax=Ferirhizobium litorale TaxID=2927786 RepID=A0AAE3QAT8_9HYPH|nr:DUF707 domain-containing protein [Fererhizobium litorale]MDI7862354.1 DUF707 domain-containing protein [Fererhizobium litorale]MDI7922372.1 DUF707 domain-containing protein [Fererhizobium litorale]